MKKNKIKRLGVILLLGIFIFAGGAYYLTDLENEANSIDANNLVSSEDEEIEQLENEGDQEVIEEDKTLSANSNKEGVTIETIFLNPEDVEEELEFDIYMDTHSGDLLELEIEEIAEIETDNGIANQEAFNWQWTQESSHHPAGNLVVKNETNEDEKLFDNEVTFLKMKLNNINGATHEFKWDLGE